MDSWMFSMKTLSILLVAFASAALPTSAAPASLDRILPVRGFCIGAPTPGQLEEFTKFITEELAPRSVNTLILRVDYNYQYASRPELASASGLSPADVKRLVEVSRP